MRRLQELRRGVRGVPQEERARYGAAARARAVGAARAARPRSAGARLRADARPHPARCARAPTSSAAAPRRARARARYHHPRGESKTVRSPPPFVAGYVVIFASACPTDVFINIVVVQVFANLDDDFVRAFTEGPLGTKQEALETYCQKVEDEEPAAEPAA